jgi:formylglycine-generating enzyme required for sulfatase activity
MGRIVFMNRRYTTILRVGLFKLVTAALFKAGFVAIFLFPGVSLAQDKIEDNEITEIEQIGEIGEVKGVNQPSAPFEVKEVVITTSNLGLTFVLIPAGSFEMGAGPGFQGDGEYERPAHTVTIPKPFRLSRSEVTINQWYVIMGTKPSRRRDGNMPVDNVSWEDVQEFLLRLNQQDTRGYRLPTEAEWEFAARGGSSTAYYFGNDPEPMKEYGYCGENFTDGTTHPVMKLKPNGYGLYDMIGNLSEWVSDWFGEDYYAQSPRNNPAGPPAGTEKVHRGGAYASDLKVCQSAWRNSDLPFVRSMLIGFRIAYDE